MRQMWQAVFRIWTTIKYLNTILETRYIRKNTKKHFYISNTKLTITPHILYYINCSFNYSKLITHRSSKWTVFRSVNIHMRLRCSAVVFLWYPYQFWVQILVFNICWPSRPVIYIYSWPKCLAKDLLQLEAAQDLLWPMATTK